MMSSNIAARPAINGIGDNRNVQTCDADSVRIVKTQLTLDGAGHFVWCVLWVERNVGHKRRFCRVQNALLYAAGLKCRLEIDSYRSEIAATVKQSTRSSLDQQATVTMRMDAAYEAANGSTVLGEAA